MSTSEVPQKMKGVQLQGFGGPEVFQYKTDLPVPVPREGEILVKNEYIGINYVDIYWRTGMMGSAPNGIIGREAEGSIVATGSGNVNDLEVGERVVWLALGGYAEYTAIPASKAYLVPASIQPGISAAALLQGLTAFILTHRIVEVKKDDWVLVHAAAGGVGLWLCQLLRLLGANTIGTASTAEKMKLAEENGINFMINYKKESNLVQRVMEITGGQGVNFVYDSVGKDQTENNINVVSTNGTIVTFGASSGIPGQISPTKLASKNARFVGPSESALMRYVGTRMEFEKWCEKLFDAIAKNQVRVKIHNVYSLSDIVQIHKDFQSRKTTGKVLARV